MKLSDEQKRKTPNKHVPPGGRHRITVATGETINGAEGHGKSSKKHGDLTRLKRGRNGGEISQQPPVSEQILRYTEAENSRKAKSQSEPLKGLIDSANKHRANKATSKGWQSINTEPSPAPVPSNPWANKPWKRQASTSVNRANQTKSRRSKERRRPLRRTQSSRANPAGSNRRLATSQLPPVVSSGAMAVIAVPQRTKGSTISNQMRTEAMEGGDWCLF